MPTWIVRLALAIVKLVLVSPFYFAVGCFKIARALLGAVQDASRVPAKLADTIVCPHGHENATVGRYECAECKAVYLGWVGRCPVCGAGASYIACDTCGVAVMLPWERRG